MYDYLNGIHSRAGISVLQSGGMRPRTAICRGAVFKGFLDGVADEGGSKFDVDKSPISVTSTIARQSFGTAKWVPFIEGVHLDADKEWDDDEGEWKANNQMDWFLKKVCFG